MGYTVRRAQGYDIDKVTEKCRVVLSESVYSHLDFDHEKCANWLCGVILEQPGWFMRVIVDEDDEVVGGIVCRNETTLFGKDSVAYDVTIMVAAEHRGKCLRPLLQIIREYRDWAERDGAKLIKMGVSSGINIDKASVFMERMGFPRIGAMHGMRIGV